MPLARAVLDGQALERPHVRAAARRERFSSSRQRTFLQGGARLDPKQHRRESLSQRVPRRRSSAQSEPLERGAARAPGARRVQRESERRDRDAAADRFHVSERHVDRRTRRARRGLCASSARSLARAHTYDCFQCLEQRQQSNYFGNVNRLLSLDECVDEQLIVRKSDDRYHVADFIRNIQLWQLPPGLTSNVFRLLSAEGKATITEVAQHVGVHVDSKTHAAMHVTEEDIVRQVEMESFQIMANKRFFAEN